MRDLFLMKFTSGYELLCSNLMTCVPSPSLDTCFSELIREEQHQHSQVVLDKQSLPAMVTEVAFVAEGRLGYPRTRQCYSCKDYGHIAKDCKKQFCNYCKKEGHIIMEYRCRPHNRNNAKAYHTVATQLVSMEGSTPLAYVVPVSSSNATTPESILQIILQALSSIGFSGDRSSNSRNWYLDSGASNHITGSLHYLLSPTPYFGPLKISTADEIELSIDRVGNINSSSMPLKDVFFVPHLSTNLLSIGQLVKNNYNVLFSPTGCIIQDLATKKVIRRGGVSVIEFFPLTWKRQHLLPLINLENFLLFFQYLMLVINLNFEHFWHRRLGHPHSNKLLTMFNFGLLPTNISISNKDSFTICSSCFMAKSKTLPLSSSTHVSSTLLN
ncbi:zf-CCHC domain-containing protein/gag_pre-integrs domain-containing protein [Cephalotus follicularis]|uniref:Zf-CCHC domain-containing protein/gag_pre-integrs domain-containing protein n=1 Tax=Cephalotus follicularis TaxID=3775 RepID=A0A1Q3AYB4_CEPFO|nr:zf-CCHC domain-containing protein/gag_pre-integrs domain-containing protein [Cephalotus follicularis]